MKKVRVRVEKKAHSILPALTEVEDGGLVAFTQGGHGEAGYWVS